MTAISEWPSFFQMEWKFDPNGYTLQGGAIVARGEPTEDYCPDARNKMAHREFMALKMEDGNEGLLAFVNSYGLLGLDGGGPPKRESLAHLWLAHSNLWMYRHWAHEPEGPAVLASSRNGHFNAFCPQHMSAFLHREKGGRTVLKVKVGSLLAWMWLRLAQEVVGEIKLRTCKYPSCGGQWYEGPGLSSARREYCNPRCKAAHHYGMNTGKFPQNSKPTQEGGSK